MRTTITVNDKIYRALKLRAVDTDTSVSALIEDAIKYQILEDLEDSEAVRSRAGEESLSYERFVKELEADGLL